MILQELVRYYDRQIALRDSDIAPSGWIRRPVDYLIELTLDGHCVNLIQKFSIEGGERISWQMLLPAIGKQALKHTNSGKDANLLWDNASFVLGWQDKRKTKLSNFIETIKKWLPNSEDAGVIAVLRFLSNIEINIENPTELLTRYGVLSEFEKREPVIAFQLVGDTQGPIHFRKGIVSAYSAMSGADRLDTPRGTCLVTGKSSVELAANETVIRGIRGAQTSGANLISFNKPSFVSYGKQDRGGESAPVSREASASYSKSLNHLLESDKSRLQVGDLTIVFWSDFSGPFESLLSDLFDDDKDDPNRGVRAVIALQDSIRSGVMSTSVADLRYFILGLSAPSGGRITVRSWDILAFVDLAPKFLEWYEDLRIVHAPHDSEHIPLRPLLATACAPSKERPSGDLQKRPLLAAQVLRSILGGGQVPAPWLQGLVERIRAEQATRRKDGKPAASNVSYFRAASIKAILNRTIRLSKSSEMEFQVALDRENTNVAYRLGRLFAAYERIQSDAAKRDLNRTIRDAYFGAAMATPASVFPRLEALNSHYMRILRRDKPGLHVNRDNTIIEIMGPLPVEGAFPRIQAIGEQGRFALGYYHQRQDFFTRKEPQPTAAGTAKLDQDETPNTPQED